jgi:endonuclease III
MDLLFKLAMWHGLAKLCLHTESTIQALESSTTRLGIALRKFQSTTCAEFVTCNLLSEEATRGRQKAAKAKLQPTAQKSKSKGKEPESKGKKKVSSTLRDFGLSNYKTHALPDYARTIQEFGTTDGYSTQNVCSLFKVKFRVEVN